MSENSEPAAANEKTPPPNLSHTRILWIMTGVLILSLLLSLIYGTQDFTFGLIIGGILAYVNYYWLRVSLKNIFDSISSTGEKPQFLALKYFGRYATLGAVVAIVLLTQAVSVVAVLLGIGAFAFAVVIEGLIRIFLSLNSKKEDF